MLIETKNLYGIVLASGGEKKNASKYRSFDLNLKNSFTLQFQKTCAVVN